MQKAFFALLWSLLGILALLGCARSVASPTKVATSDLMAELIAALNSKEDGKLKEFAETKCGPGVPVEQRVQRLKGLAEQGAPFTIVKTVGSGPDSIRALVEDKNKERFGFIMELTPDGKMARMMMAPPEELDAPPPKDYTGWTDLASLTESIRSDTKNPAISVAVIRDGKLETATSGVREDGKAEKVGDDEPWSIGSIGKPICTTIIGKLIDDGKLDWGTTVGEALKGMPMKDGYKAVTLEQLMQHRAGVPQDLGMTAPRFREVIKGEKDPTKMRMNYAADILSRDLLSKPGEKFAYSNAGYALLGVIAEKVTGKPYEQLVREMVYKPLGLKNSYTGGETLPKDRPSGHMKNPDGLKPANFTGPLEVLYAPAGGGLYMSVTDLAKFGQAHLDGLNGKDGLLKAATFARLHQGHPEGAMGQVLYACGWGIEKTPTGALMHTHNGSNGTMRAQLAFFPKANLVVAAFVNAGGESEPSPPLQAVFAVAGRYAG